MKRLIYILAAVFIAAIPFESFAVTDKEMEQARVIAAQTYLRWANDGSGYLDAIHPSTMAALEKNLKPKEKENLKAFKSIAVPKDYASWDKAKLVEYWSVTAFASPNLSDSGRRGKDRVRKKLNAMTVAAPAPKAPATPAVQSPDNKANTTSAPAADPASSAASSSTQTASPASSPNQADVVSDSAKAALNQAEAIATSALDNEEEEIEIQKAENHTWIYIVILCILVAIVVALVVFASNVMKRNAAKDDESSHSKTPAPEAAAHPTTAAPMTQKETNEEINRMREKFAATLTAKNGEIHLLNKKLEEALRQNTALKNNLEALSTEVNTLRNRLSAVAQTAQPSQASLPNQAAASAACTTQAAQTAPQAAQAVIATAQEAPVAAQTAQASAQPSPAAVPLRSIYLGRANAKGIFIRADRTLNLGNSIYRLDTTDGYAGSFRVANDPTVWQMALLTPRESLGGACVAADLDNTEGMQRIVNDASGTAIFEGGCWKVIRKAKIHYE